MNQSNEINSLMEALAKAQGQIRGALKDSSNPHFRSKFADLASVWEACREPLAINGLAVVQTIEPFEEGHSLVTTLGHSSGQWMRSIVKLPVQKPGPQELGSCLSYCRRYALAAIVGVYQEDDDGERAAQPYRAAPQKLDAMQCRNLDGWLEKFPDGASWICQNYKISHPHELLQSDYDHVVSIFRKKSEKEGK